MSTINVKKQTHRIDIKNTTAKHTNYKSNAFQKISNVFKKFEKKYSHEILDDIASVLQADSDQNKKDGITGLFRKIAEKQNSKNDPINFNLNEFTSMFDSQDSFSWFGFSPETPAQQLMAILWLQGGIESPSLDSVQKYFNSNMSNETTQGSYFSKTYK